MVSWGGVDWRVGPPTFPRKPVYTHLKSDLLFGMFLEPFLPVLGSQNPLQIRVKTNILSCFWWFHFKFSGVQCGNPRPLLLKGARY